MPRTHRDLWIFLIIFFSWQNKILITIITYYCRCFHRATCFLVTTATGWRGGSHADGQRRDDENNSDNVPLHRRMTQDKTKPLRYQGRSARPAAVGRDPSASTHPEPRARPDGCNSGGAAPAVATTVRKNVDVQQFHASVQVYLPGPYANARRPPRRPVGVRPRLPPRTSSSSPRRVVCDADFRRFSTVNTPRTRGEEGRRSDESCIFWNRLFLTAQVRPRC